MIDETVTYLNPVVIIAGPTASGKTAMALDVAREFSGTVINADSMQVYADLRVLTARPGPEEEARAPHRLFGALPASVACSVGRWLELAQAEIEASHADGRLPIAVGGTGLYLKALTEGLADIPDVPQDIRRQVQGEYERLGGEAFRDRLAKLDPTGAAELPSGDRQRLERAMAVVRATGRPLADWQGEQPDGPALKARFWTIVLMPGRSGLYAACNARFDGIMANGALDEVRALVAQGLDPGLPAMKALGVPELARHLAGEITLDEAAEAAKQATRHFAKRQMTWLRNQLDPDLLIEAPYTADLRERVVSSVRGFLA